VSPEPISVLVVDDHELVREHVARAILADERLELAGQAGDGEEALRQVQERHPDALILDVEMPKLDGVGVLRALRGRGELPKVMLFTGHAGRGQLHDAVRAGPDGLLFKTETDQICEALIAMLREEKLSWARLNLERAQAIASARVELSSRDIWILRLAAEGRSVAQTARELRVAPRTAEQMRHDVRAKLGRATTEGAIALGFALGFLT
jgi:two-component system NarL family response regulator